MLKRLFYVLLRCVFALFKLLPDEWWRMTLSAPAPRYEGRELQARATVFARLVAANGAPTSDKDIAKTRLAYDLCGLGLDQAPMRMATVRDMAMDLDGRSLKTRLYDADTVDRKKGLVLFFHGGGFVIGGLDSHDHFCRRLAQYSGKRVLAVDYRMGPEHRFPAAADDACASWDWVLDHADMLNIDRNQITIAGDSAGGNLAMIVGNYTATRSDGEKPAGLGLIYPMCDATLPDPRIADLAKMELILGEQVLSWFTERYKPNVDKEEEAALMADPKISPLKDKDSILQWPPVMLITCGFDPLRPGGEALLALLEAHDKPVLYQEYRDLFHGFITMGSLFRETDSMARDLSRFLADPR